MGCSTEEPVLLLPHKDPRMLAKLEKSRCRAVSHDEAIDVSQDATGQYYRLGQFVYQKFLLDTPKPLMRSDDLRGPFMKLDDLQTPLLLFDKLGQTNRMSHQVRPLGHTSLVESQPEQDRMDIEHSFSLYQEIPPPSRGPEERLENGKPMEFRGERVESGKKTESGEVTGLLTALNGITLPPDVNSGLPEMARKRTKSLEKYFEHTESVLDNEISKQSKFLLSDTTSEDVLGGGGFKLGETHGQHQEGETRRPFFFCSSPSSQDKPRNIRPFPELAKAKAPESAKARAPIEVAKARVSTDRQIHNIQDTQEDSDGVEDGSRKKRRFNAKQVDAEMCEIMHNIFKRHGPRCSEALYQRAVVRRAYLDGLPTMSERELFADNGEGSLLVGRVDIEVAACCLYEFKIGQPNIAKDQQQINDYLKAYDQNLEKIEIASLVYFTKSGVFVHRIR
jgi:hypothetical protein